MKTLIVGATGLLGMEVCRRLSAARLPFRAMVRATSDTNKKAELQQLGGELIEADLKTPGSLAPACAGVQAVVSTASSTLSRHGGDSIQSVDEQGQLALVDAAKAAGVRHFVFVSFRDNPRIQYPLTEAKRAVERRLIASGMAYTILRASYFMEVWLTPALGFDHANGKVRIYGEGDKGISWISFKDVARVAVAALEQPAARNAVIEVGGPQALTPREVVRVFEAAGAGEIATEHVPATALRAQLDSATDPMQKTFAGLMLQYAGGDAMDPATLARLFPFQMTSVRDFVSAQRAGP